MIKKGKGMKYIGVLGVFLLLLLCTFEDIKKKRIVTWHYLLIIPFFIIDVIVNSIWFNNISWVDRVCGVVIGVIFICISKLTKGQIGLGDGYLISIVGIMVGAFRNLEIITYSFLGSAIVSIILLTFFHYGKKHAIPFVPFLFFGLLCSLTLGGSSL